ncbi:hypothetical protein OF846_005261 [Rhodotorula toruloides]|nr:hypothetical protein OF846_005261 [Rhodotorula toruloides]
MSIAGSVLTASRCDTFVWSMSVATLQTQLSEARTATSELDGPSVYSPDFDAGRWKMRISLLSDEGAGSQSCDFFLCPTASLAQKITLSYNLQANLVISITLHEGNSSSPTRIPLALFNSSRYGDVAFHLPGIDAWIFSLKPILIEKSAHLRTLLSSDFAEGSADTVLERDFARELPSNLHAGDLDEFAELALLHESMAADEEVSLMKDVQSGDADEAAPTPSANAVSEPHSPVELLDSSATRASSRRSNATAQYHRVEVADCSYSTFFSYLYWIYYDEISFAPSRAFALSAPETASPDDSSTIAAYEAFSSLGRTYTDVQDKIVNYIVKNLDDVRKSAGWTRALELMKDEHLVGGSVILNKVLEGVVAAQEAKK